MALTDWTSVVATGFAAVASGCAAVNTLGTRRAAQERLRPHLAIQPLTNLNELQFDVYNVGEGVALTCGYMVVRGDRTAGGYVAHGTLRPGEHSRIRTLLTPDVAEGEVYAALVCRDVTGKLWGWTTHDSKRHKVKGSEIDMLAAYMALYPSVTIPEGSGKMMPSDSLTPMQVAGEGADRRLWDDLSPFKES
jgi:hypothetical protein